MSRQDRRGVTQPRIYAAVAAAAAVEVVKNPGTTAAHPDLYSLQEDQSFGGHVLEEEWGML